MRDDPKEWGAVEAEAPCECGSRWEISQYGFCPGGLGLYTACFDCSALRSFVLDAEGDTPTPTAEETGR